MREWREFEYSRAQRKTPMLETLDAMIARVEHELAAESNNEQGIYFRGR
ncbi:MAG: hypothetical protein WAW23_02590 [Candidatus Methanoperedens sp.]